MGKLTALPRPNSWILGGPTSKGGEKARAGKRREGGKKEGKMKGKDKLGKEGKGKRDEAPQLKFLATSLATAMDYINY